MPQSISQWIRTEERKAIVAELVAEGESLSAAARHIGVTQQMASKLWKSIVWEVGGQAV